MASIIKQFSNKVQVGDPVLSSLIFGTLTLTLHIILLSMSRKGLRIHMHLKIKILLQFEIIKLFLL